MAEPAGEALLAEALAVIVVSAEHLVGAFAGQHHGDMTARFLREQHRRQRGLIGEGLVEYIDPRIEGTQHIVGAEHEVMVPAAKMRRYPRRMQVLARDPAAHKTDVEGLDGAAGQVGHHRGDQARIHATAHEGTQWHVGHQHAFYRRA